MAFKGWYKKITEKKLELETLLLAFLFVTSSYMLWETFNFASSSATRFPRLTAGVVFIGSLLLLLRGYLPDRIEAALTQPPEVFETDEEIAEKQKTARQGNVSKSEESRTGTTTISTVGRPIHDSLFTALAAIGYGLLGYTIGLFLATPVFVFTYVRWFKLSWRYTIGLSLLSLFIAYVFVSVLGIPLDRGEIIFADGVVNVLLPMSAGRV